MTKYGWIFLTLLALTLAFGSRAEDGSKYIPTCLEIKHKEHQNNEVLMMTGPLSNGGNVLMIGYTRRLKKDLSLGAQTLWSDKGGYLGTGLGFIYHFGDGE